MATLKRKLQIGTETLVKGLTATSVESPSPTLAQDIETIIKDIQIVEKEVIKEVQVEIIKYIEVPVEHIVEIIKEVPVEVEKIVYKDVEKIVEVTKEVEKVVIQEIEKIVEKEVPSYINRIIMQYKTPEHLKYIIIIESFMLAVLLIDRILK